MITESYNYIAEDHKTQFAFFSEGVQGKIIKIVLFTFIKDDLWNLGFGDLVKGDIDDTIISNNSDIVKLIGTIAKITYDFSVEFPLRRIYIEPVDEKRKRLYNHVFRRHHKTINDTFQIIGLFEGLEEPYSPDKLYDIFKLKRKFV
jgi:hypothetical protein